MVFEIDKIPEDSMDFELRLEPDQFKIKEPDCILRGAVAVNGTLARMKKDVYLRGEIKAELSLPCSRCLIAVNYPVHCKVSAHYVPREPSKKWEQELELVEGDLEIEYYAENKIDVSHLVHDQILLAVPMTCLCKQDCRGLCGRCGRNLNNQPCGCSTDQPVDPRLEVLKSLREKI